MAGNALPRLRDRCQNIFLQGNLGYLLDGHSSEGDFFAELCKSVARIQLKPRDGILPSLARGPDRRRQHKAQLLRSSFSVSIPIKPLLSLRALIIHKHSKNSFHDRGRIRKLMFPEPEHGPTFLPKCCRHRFISGFVALKLWNPIGSVAPRLSTVIRATVPKAAID